MLTCDTCNQTFSTLLDYHTKHNNCSNINIIKDLDLNIIRRHDRICDYVKSNYGNDPNMYRPYNNEKIKYYLYNNGCIAVNVYDNNLLSKIEEANYNLIRDTIVRYTQQYDKDLLQNGGLPTYDWAFRNSNDPAAKKYTINYNYHDYFDISGYLTFMFKGNINTRYYHNEYLISLLDHFGNYMGEIINENKKLEKQINKITNESKNKINNLQHSNQEFKNKIKRLECYNQEFRNEINILKMDNQKLVDAHKYYLQLSKNKIKEFEDNNKKIEINNLDDTNKLNNKIDENTNFQNHVNELMADMINTMDNKIKELSDSKYQIINLTNKIKELEMNISNKDNHIEKLNNFINSQTNINNLTTQMINTIDYNQLISRIKSLEDHCCCHD